MSQLMIFAASAPTETASLKPPELPKSQRVQQSNSEARRISLPAAPVRAAIPAPTSAIYGLCRCGAAISVPGLDADCCPRCGWVSRLGGGR